MQDAMGTTPLGGTPYSLCNYAESGVGITMSVLLSVSSRIVCSCKETEEERGHIKLSDHPEDFGMYATK